MFTLWSQKWPQFIIVTVPPATQHEYLMGTRRVSVVSPLLILGTRKSMCSRKMDH